jgi:hypothetical protein
MTMHAVGVLGGVQLRAVYMQGYKSKALCNIVISSICSIRVGQKRVAFAIWPGPQASSPLKEHPLHLTDDCDQQRSGHLNPIKSWRFVDAIVMKSESLQGVLWGCHSSHSNRTNVSKEPRCHGQPPIHHGVFFLAIFACNPIELALNGASACNVSGFQRPLMDASKTLLR